MTRKQYPTELVYASSSAARGAVPAPILGHEVSPWRRPFILRRVSGSSMEPNLKPGQLVVARGFFLCLKPYDVVIIRHHGTEKIKRIVQIKGKMLYVEGDNPNQSTDSRHFGWLPISDVIGKLTYPLR